jgi:hypothetical protein
MTRHCGTAWGKTVFNSGKVFSGASANLVKQIKLAFKALKVTEEPTSDFYFHILLFNR